MVDKMDKELNQLNNDEDDGDIEETESNFETEFKDNINDLKSDVEHIDTRMANLSMHIMTMESNLEMLKNSIEDNKNNNKDTTKLYGVYNKMIELLANLENTYQKYLETKFKYRKEHDDVRGKIVDLKNKSDDMKTQGSLEEVLLSLNKQISNGGNESLMGEIKEDVEKIEEDEDYKL